MKILAIETATLTGSVALLHQTNDANPLGGEIVGEITLSVSVQHSERLMPAITELLRSAGTGTEEIDLFAVSKGPGSFTGLRIGIAAAQGLALAHRRPVVGVSTLEALAQNGLFFPGLIVPLLNAYRGEVYQGLYQMKEGRLESLEEEKVIPISETITLLRSHIEREQGAPLFFLGNGCKESAQEIVAALGSDRVSFAPPPWNHPRASQVAWLALEKWNLGMKGETVLPNYLRRPG